MALKTLKVSASFRGVTGYDHHARAFVRELCRQGVAVELHEIKHPGWEQVQAGDDPLFPSLNRPVPARTALHFAMPHEAWPYPGVLNVNHTMFEATPVHATWIAHNREHDLVLVPSESSRQAWIAGGTPAECIRLCPLGVDTSLFGRPAAPLPLRRDNGVPVADFRVRFLNVSVWGPRKNLDGLLGAWMRATSRGDDAILMLKVGFYWPGAYEGFRREIDAVEQQTGRRLTDAAPVHMIADILPDRAMPRLYAAATHYISTSHGEGWDLPMMEAGAAGLRLIAPDHSAYPAYLDRETATLLPSRLVPARFQGDPYYAMLFEKAHWWDPDEDATVAAIRAAIDGADATRASPRERILRDFSWEQSTRRLIEILTELEADHG